MPTRKPKPVVPASPAKRPSHRPPFEPTKEQRLTVEVMTAGGIDQVSICGLLKITLKTFRKHFRHEIDTAVASVNMIVVAAHLKRIKAGDMNAIKWWEQSRMKWQERVVLVDGGAEVDPRELSDADLEARRLQLRRHPAVVRAEKASGTVH
jgi:hypothetical protein